MFSVALLLLAATAPVQSGAPAPAPSDEDVTIPFARQHRLRDWQSGPDDDTVYVRDYRQQWYRVKLVGTCMTEGPYLALGYTTTGAGTFDRFSSVFDPAHPRNSCSVVSIARSAPPAGKSSPAKDTVQ